jgi:hypothetical protein
MIGTALKMLSALVLSASLATAAVAAAPDLIDPEQPAAATEYELETVRVVHNWILCVSETSARSLASAREEGTEAAAVVYEQLAAAKSCGRFAKLGVVLKQPLYRSAANADYDARVFAALVNIGVGWQSAFVVSGLAD